MNEKMSCFLCGKKINIEIKQEGCYEEKSRKKEVSKKRCGRPRKNGN
jgi:hypothetical protein